MQDCVCNIEGPAEEVLTARAGVRPFVQEVARRSTEQKIATLELAATVVEGWRRDSDPPGRTAR